MCPTLVPTPCTFPLSVCALLTPCTVCVAQVWAGMSHVEVKDEVLMGLRARRRAREEAKQERYERRRGIRRVTI